MVRPERAVTALLQRKALAIALVSCFAGYAYANPTNPAVVSGAATFAASGKTLNVTNTPGAIINWQGFSVKADELTRFIQQNAQSAVLNRVTSQEQSAILGQLLSNGRVYLVNPNGITVGAGARIDTAGFVASSLNLSDSDAIAGKFKLQDTGSSGKVVNNGTITTAGGGFVYLVAPNVENNGVITSPKGEIILAAGKSVELVDSQKPELRVLLTAPGNTAINVGKMIAEAGSIGIFAGIIKQSGLISANSAVVGENGKIVLRAKKDITLAAGSKTEASGPRGGVITIQSESGTTLVAGTVEAKATSTPTTYQIKDPVPRVLASDVPQNPDVVPVTVDLKANDTIVIAGKGGSIAILGDRVGLTEHAAVNTSGESGGGQILVGGDYQGKNPEVQNAQLTYVGKDVQLVADAILKGDGGRVIVWADKDTNFVGSLFARGGKDGGNGGFAEVSGKHAIYYRGRVSLVAPRGAVGTVLFDPDDIQITGGTGDGSDNTDATDAAILHSVGITGNAAGVGSNTAGTIAYSDEGVPVATPFIITEKEIEEQSKTANIILQANKNITVTGTFDYITSGNPGDGLGIVALANASHLTLQTRNNAGDGAGGINLTAVTVELRTNTTGNITINAGTDGGAAGTATLGKLTAAGTGAINVTAGGGGTITVNDALSANSGSVTFTADRMVIGNTITAATATLRPDATGRAIDLGSTGNAAA
ncbi:MAG: filamentous hemagglutinin N-terminal domain-containing protein, partial [Betaproteobacteria bacterium]